jgi:hypothetical protein
VPSRRTGRSKGLLLASAAAIRDASANFAAHLPEQPMMRTLLDPTAAPPPAPAAAPATAPPADATSPAAAPTDDATPESDAAPDSEAAPERGTTPGPEGDPTEEDEGDTAPVAGDPP